MDYSGRTRTLSSLVKDMKNFKFSFDSPLQRKENQWNRLQKSELIDSILRSYPLDPIRSIKLDSGILDVIDGKQRMTTIRDYMNDVFALSKNLESVTIDGNEYQIANKKFSKLDEVIQDKIKYFEILVYSFTNCTDKDVREMFRRQNNGKNLSNLQKRTVLESEELRNVTFDLTSHPFWDKLLTKTQRKGDIDKDLVREILMLTEASNEYDFGSFRSEDINKFIDMYNDKINEEKIALVKQSLDKLYESFEEIKLNKISIPMVVYGMYRMIKDNKDIEKYITWLRDDFIANYDQNENFKAYCQSSTSSSENVKGRLEYFRNVIREM